MNLTIHLGRRGLLFLIIGLTWLVLPQRPAVAKADTDAAVATVRELADGIWALLARTDLDEPARLDRLLALFESKTDVNLLARLVLGRYWRELPDDQKPTYVRLFRDVVLRRLAERLNRYAGETQGEMDEHFRIRESIPAGKRDVLVRSEVVPKSGKPIAVDWRLRARDGEPKIIDVIIEGVSLLVSQRSEFAAVIEKQGLDGLLADLAARAKQDTSQAAHQSGPVTLALR